MKMNISPIIEVEGLLKIYKDRDVMIFDASNNKNARENYLNEHLEGAFFIDINSQLADIKNDFALGGRHPLPEIKTFLKTLSLLGIDSNKHIIIYDDNNGSNAAARFWWMLKSVGHEKVQVLNGGLSEAKKRNFPLSSKTEVPKSSSKPYLVNDWILPTVDINEVEKVAKDPRYIVVDVRDKDRYDGIREPIDLIAGHIPGAINIPFTENLTTNGLFLNPTELRNLYQLKLADKPAENVIIHCGSGVTACHTLLALAYAGLEIPKLYVGSWSEWSRNNKEIGKIETS
ncbi:sulfurtransferase [Pelobium sp.]|nr:sulfurtransferase [Pelobium sp.]MDA9554814.1 sulfurtransferase [Pelobium sp.]